TMPYEHELYCCLQPDGPPIQFLLQVLGESQTWANPADNVMYDVGGGHFLGEGTVWQAPSSGTHYLSVSSDDWAAAGAYQIAVTETLDDFGNNSEHAGSIAIDTPVQGRIDYEGD